MEDCLLDRSYKCGICGMTGHNARSSKFHNKNNSGINPTDEPGMVKFLRSENSNLKRRLLKQENIKDILKFAISETLVDLPKLEIPKKPRHSSNKDSEEIAVLHISDTQIGKITSTYDSDIAAERLFLLAEKTIEITNTRRSAANINELRLYLGGDMVEGEQIFPGQAHQIDQSVFDQAVRTGPTILVKVILRLLEEFPKIHIVTQSGNHGRNGRYGGDAHHRTNWDNVCYDMIKVMLLGFSGETKEHGRNLTRSEFNDRVTFDISESWYALDKIYDTSILLIHGDQITGGAGFPFYSLARKLAGWIDVVPAPFAYIFGGHFHTPVMLTYNHRIYLGNGTTESDNDYAANNLGACGYPCQRLCFFNKKYGLISDDLIYLMDKKQPI